MELEPGNNAERTPELQHEDALMHWRMRHDQWDRSAHVSLDPHLSWQLRALRDHDMDTPDGIDNFLELVEDYFEEEKQTVDGYGLRYASGLIKAALAEPDDELHQEEQLDLALQETDHVLQQIIETKEINALCDTAVAETFLREVFDEPGGVHPESQGDFFEALIQFEDDQPTDEEEPKVLRSREWKVQQLAQFVYQLKGKYEGGTIKRIIFQPLTYVFEEEATPYEIIDHGDTEENKHLWDWAVEVKNDRLRHDLSS